MLRAVILPYFLFSILYFLRRTQVKIRESRKPLQKKHLNFMLRCFLLDDCAIVFNEWLPFQ